MGNNQIFRVSSIVSVYNSEKFFQGRIEDLLEQTIGGKHEIIIINSGSTQAEEKIYEKYFSNIQNITYMRTQERETIYKAWNRGIKIAKGRYITNANTDDRLKNDAYEILAAVLDENPDIAIVYGNQYISHIPNEKFYRLSYKKIKVNRKYSHIKLLDKYTLGSQPMWRASLHLKENIWFDEDYEIAGDYDFACRVAENHKIFKINDVLGVYYLSESKSNKEFQNVSLTIIESERIREHYSLKYIENISNSNKKGLINIYICYKIIPKLLFRIINKALSLFARNNELTDRDFIFYLMSLLEEKHGNIHKAKNICKRLNVNHNIYNKLYKRLFQYE